MEQDRRRSLEALCRAFGVQILYAFGSRAREAAEWLNGQREAMEPGGSDLDVGLKPRPVATRWSVRRKVEAALAFEEFFNVSRVDLVLLPESDPFLAANIIRGERLFAQDDHYADEYELYVLRRAGDCAFLERERLALILESTP